MIYNNTLGDNFLGMKREPQALPKIIKMELKKEDYKEKISILKTEF